MAFKVRVGSRCRVVQVAYKVRVGSWCRVGRVVQWPGWVVGVGWVGWYRWPIK